jgi:hypothetical protein
VRHRSAEGHPLGDAEPMGQVLKSADLARLVHRRRLTAHHQHSRILLL